ncbi:MAG: SLC13 family permease [Chloroflexi bacterium]|nr:SLC13 family permease [Chloroflexota bacterium]
MTSEIALSLAILAMAVFLFISERLRVDLVALLVLVSLAVTDLVTPLEAFSGFSNPAIVTVWAVFILSGGLTQTGVANTIGRRVLKLAGNGEVKLILLIMLTSGVLSAFMNNIGVAAMLLPVIVNIARQTGYSPSKLLMPLAFGSLLGGMNTLIGTPPNILASIALQDNGLPAFKFFDFVYVGFPLMITGVVYMIIIGRRLLPVEDLASRRLKSQQHDLGEIFDLRERLFIINLPNNSDLDGKTLAQSHFGAALKINIIGILRKSETIMAPAPQAVLKSNDRLLASGGIDRITELGKERPLVIEEDDPLNENLTIERLVSTTIGLAEVNLSSSSPMVGKTITEIDFRARFGVNVLAILRDGTPLRTNLQDLQLDSRDILLVQAPNPQLELLHASDDFIVSKSQETDVFRLHERLLLMGVPKNSSLVGKTLAESNLGDAYNLSVLGIIRGETNRLMPNPTEKLLAHDTLLVEGKEEDLIILRSMQELEIESESVLDLDAFESDTVGLVEVVLSPHTMLVDKTLRQLHFREKFGLSVLAIWRGGQAFHDNLRDVVLRFGDALLLYGRRERIGFLADEPDFIVLSEEAQKVLRVKKAPLASIIMAGVVLAAGVGWLPISIAAVAGATLMILSGCLTMDEAYRAIKWQAVFLIAGMLPLGIALQNSGAADYLASGMVEIIGPLGHLAMLAGFFVLTMLASQVMPNPVVIVLIAPIAINAAANLNISPIALIMLVAIAASTTFLSPVGHPANVLIMGPGGYRIKDYFKVGLPLTVVVFVVTMIVLPIFWPLFP